MCVDPLFPPPEECPVGRKMHVEEGMVEENRLELIFDEAVEGEGLRGLFGGQVGLESEMGRVEEEAEVYEN